ncbi:MAG: peptidase m20 [Bacteroidetes bacterium]|nr:peptidase m20 [Bacteroidota bacterium]
MIKALSNKIYFLLITCCFSLSSNAQLNPVTVISDYLKINSVSGHEKKAGKFMKKLCDELGFHTTVFSDSDSSYNFCASLVPLKKKLPSVLLINHIDVVPVDEKGNWKHPAFSGAIDNDTLYGRGAIDMKGLAVMQIFALKNIKESIQIDSLRKNLVILFLSGEETGGINGAKKIIQPEIIEQLNPMVVFGEGGGGLKNVIDGKENELCFFVSNAEKKSIWIKLEATVKSSGHGSVPSSKTANKLLLKAIQKIEETEERILVDRNAKRTLKAIGKIMGGYKGFILKHFNWWIFKPLRKKIIHSNEALQTLVTNSYQLTQIQNPQGSINQVSQTASAYYDCRLLPNRSERPLLMKLLFRIVDPRIKITVVDESPEADPSKLDIHYEIMKTSLLTVFPSAHVIPLLFPATTDNSYFRSIDIPSFGVLPFELNREMVESVHANNEKIPTKAIDDGIRVYTELLRNYTK